MMDAGGGIEAFLDDHAMIVVADHSHALIEHRCDLPEVFAEWTVMAPGGRTADPEIALCPNSRAAMVYVLAEEARAVLARPLAEAGLRSPAVDLAMWREDGEGVIASSAGELRFAPGGELRDARGRSWSANGDLVVLGAELRDGLLVSEDYPDALNRAWAALTCRPRATSCSARRRAGSSPTGAGSRTSARAATARCTPATRSARSPSAESIHRTGTTSGASPT